ncbi:MAG: VCBS repeat-containing protein, partial [Myxococcota bacterium]|nr:VCBS repeat-containing protein [Myxococcota bacterium]
MVPWSLGPAWDAQPPADNLSWQYTGGGMAVADLNGDDRPDVYLPSSADSQLLLSDGDTWRDGSDGLPVAESTDLGVGAIVADVDDDGDLDLYTLVLHGQNRLLQNDGSGRFVDVTEAAGLLAGEWDTTHAVFADVSGDGVLDLLVANHFEGPHLGDAIISGDFLPAHDNRLFVGDGSGGFTDATETLPAAFRSGYGFVVMAEDFDGDGHDELLSVNDFGPFWEPNTVLRRDGSDWRIDEGFEGLDIGVYGMGAGVGDLNADGSPDLLITSWGELVLLESTGDGAWFRAGAARGIQMAPDQSTAWGAILADLDNDTDLDATVAMGPLVMPSDVAEQQAEVRGLITLQNQPDALYVKDEDGRFTDVADAWGVGHPGVSRGVLPVDLDGDGWLDLMRRGLDGPAVAWRARCGNRGALVVSLEQPAPNVRAVGAQLEVRGAGRVQWRRIRAGGTGHAVGAD